MLKNSQVYRKGREEKRLINFFGGLVKGGFSLPLFRKDLSLNLLSKKLSQAICIASPVVRNEINLRDLTIVYPILSFQVFKIIS